MKMPKINSAKVPPFLMVEQQPYPSAPSLSLSRARALGQLWQDENYNKWLRRT